MMPPLQRLSPSWWAVRDQSKRYCGYVLDRGRSGYEALDAGDRSLGRFDKLETAAKVVFEHEQQ
jgi:hypothetical protein